MEPGTRPHSCPAAQGLSAWGRSAPWKEVPSSPGRRGVNPLGSAPSAGCTAPATPRRQPRPRGPGPGRCRQPATSRSRGGPGPASTARGPHPSVPACATDPAPRPTGPLARARMPTVEGLLPRGPAGLSPRAACRHLPPPQSGCHQKVTMGRPPQTRREGTYLATRTAAGTRRRLTLSPAPHGCDRLRSSNSCRGRRRDPGRPEPGGCSAPVCRGHPEPDPRARCCARPRGP